MLLNMCIIPQTKNTKFYIIIWSLTFYATRSYNIGSELNFFTF